MPQAIDYAALAAQARKTPIAPVDYTALAAQARQGTTPQPQAPPAPPPQPTEQASWVRSAVSTSMPTVAGVVGGIVGGKTGAAIGGASGQGYRQLIDHAGEIPGALVDVARNVITQPRATVGGFIEGAARGAADAGIEGAMQAGGQALGESVAWGGTKMAKWLMNRATTRVSAKLMSDFPELSDTLIDNALTVSKGGYNKARALLMAAKAKATVALNVAERAGHKIPIEMNADLAESLKTALLEKLVKTGKIPVTPNQPLSVASSRLDPATKAIFSQIDAAANGSTFELTPIQADLFKTQLQKESRALYANRVAPNGQKAMGMDATERGEFASRLNDAVDAIASGYKAANAEAKPLIGAVRGIQQAIRPNGNLYQAMVRPAIGAVLGEETGRRAGMNPYASGVAGAVLTSPAGMSREAIILAHPVMQQTLRQLPKPIAQALADFVTNQLPGLQAGQGQP